MKILQINANYGLGSTGLIMRDIGDAIVDSGHEEIGRASCRERVLLAV